MEAVSHRPRLPDIPTGSVRRTRLERRLDAAAERAVTVVTGPPGGGKTVLLATWAAERSAAWITLRGRHRDAARLWRDLVAALAGVGVTLESDAAGPTTLPGDLRIRAAEDRPVLVLDDVHLLRGQALALIRALAAECGPDLALIVASRSDPDLSLGRLRVEHRLGELHAAELAFTLPEAGTLLDTHGIELAHPQLERLMARTEGWAAGLRMAVLSLQGVPDTDRALAAFTGHDQCLADYLSDEVLARQSPHMREFLLRTSIAGRICGGLADALTDRNDGGRTLADLRAAGLFLTAVDDDDTWFRFHPLFAEHLRAHLRLEHPGLEPELYGRAARWLAEHGRGDEALPYALQADDPEAMATLLSERWLDLLLSGQAADAVFAAARLRPTDPKLAVAAAGASLATGDPARAQTVLGPIDDYGDDTVAGMGGLLAARARSDIEGARLAAERTLEAVADPRRASMGTDAALRALTLLHLGLAEFESGSPDAARDALDAAGALAIDARRDRVILECAGRSAVLELLSGRLRRAEATARAACALASAAGWDHTAANAWAHATLAAVHWLRDELDDAEHHADAGAAAAYAAGELPVAHAVRLVRAHLAAARGDQVRGRAMRYAVIKSLPAMGSVLNAWSEALGPCPWAQENFRDLDDTLAVAIMLLGHGDALSALRRVEPLLAAEEPMHPTRRLHAWLIVAVARQALGRSHDASEGVERALEIASPEGYRRPFAEGGSAVLRLLHRHASLPTAYAPLVSELIDGLPAVAATPAGLLEPLSERELDVLRLLPTLLPNTEIASELFVTLNTVKTHVKAIYRKLEVSSRREAVARARQLRLI